MQAASEVHEQGAVDDRDTFLHGVRDLLSIHSSKHAYPLLVIIIKKNAYPLVALLDTSICFNCGSCYLCFQSRQSRWITNICLSTWYCSANIRPAFRLAVSAIWPWKFTSRGQKQMYKWTVSDSLLNTLKKKKKSPWKSGWCSLLHPWACVGSTHVANKKRERKNIWCFEKISFFY